MRGKQYVAVIVILLLVMALPYTPLSPTRSSQHVTQEEARQNPDSNFPEFDSDGDGLNDSYELELGLDPFNMDSNGNGIPDAQEQEFWEDLSNSDEVPSWLSDLYDPEGDLDGDGIPNYNDTDVDGDGIPNSEDPDSINPNQFGQEAPIDNFYGQDQDPQDLTQPLFAIELTHINGVEVPSESSTLNPRYWRAAAYDEYTGSQWRTSSQYRKHVTPRLHEKPDYDNEVRPGLATSTDIYTYRIQYLTGISSYLPTALHTIQVRPESPGGLTLNDLEVDSEDAYWTEKSFQSYSFDTIEYVFGSDQDGASVKSNARSSYLEYPADLPRRPEPDKEDFYELSARLKAEADAAYGGRASDYQLAAYISDYLSSSGEYLYNLHVTPGPPERDSVDYFLFESKEGKCTNFASAFLLLARENGLPSRLAVGYALGEVDTDMNIRYVTYGNAHAWPEVLFQDYGWVGFEPTAPYVAGGDPANKSANSTGEDDLVTGNATDPGSNNTNPDTDGDGLDDDVENALGTDFTNPDTDGDGLWDGDELDPATYQLDGFDNFLQIVTDPTTNDTDGDGLADRAEMVGIEHPGTGLTYRTDPSDADSDDDGLLDGQEFTLFPVNITTVTGPNTTQTTTYLTYTLPNDPDTDGDGLADGLELGLAVLHNDTGAPWSVVDADNTTITHPNNPDTDGDGLRDGEEDRNRNGGVEGGAWNNGFGPGETDPLNPDTDFGGRGDGNELEDDTNPLDGSDDLIDSDRDGIVDPEELIPGEDGYITNATNPDTDGDGMDDGWEVANGLNPTEDDADGDPDNDGLSNLNEYNFKTFATYPLRLDPQNPDTDGDRLPDGWEWERLNLNFSYWKDFFHPYKADSDNVGANDGNEDYDGDGLNNYQELFTYSTAWNSTDTEGDGLWDGDEVRPRNLDRDGVNNPQRYVSSPLSNDTDGDGLTDLEEVTGSRNPYDGGPTDPRAIDTDSDGLNDSYEVHWWWNLTGNETDPRLDWNVEGWSTSDPTDPDTDGDGLEDGDVDELNPLVPSQQDEEEVGFKSKGGRGGNEPENPGLVTKGQLFTATGGLTSNVEGLKIQIYLNRTVDTSGTRLGSTTTNATGDFVFPGLTIPDNKPAGDYLLRYHLPRQTLNSTVYKEAWSDPWDLTVRANTTLAVSHSAYVPAGGWLNFTGSLRDTGGLALEGARVNLSLNSGTNATVATEAAFSLQDGSFAFALPIDNPGNYSLWLEYGGGAFYNASAANGTFEAILASLNFSAQWPASLEAGQTFRVNGTIQGAEAPPLAGTLRLLLGTTTLATHPAANGNFTFNASLPATVQAGNRTLQLRFESDNPAFNPDGSLSRPVFITAPAALTLRVTPTLSLRNNTVVLSGKLTDNGDRPLEGSVGLGWEDTPLAWVETLPDDGTFTFELEVGWSAALGEVNLTAIYNGTAVYYGTNSSAQLYLQAATAIDLPDQEVVRGENFTIQGILVDDAGAPLAGQAIDLLFGTEGRLLAQGLITDTEGRFSFQTAWNESLTENLTQPHLIEADFAGQGPYLDSFALATLTPLTRTVVTLEELPPKQRSMGSIVVQGSVKDNFGTALEGLNLTLNLTWVGGGPAGETREPGNFSLETSRLLTTDANGTFQLTLAVDPNHPVGNYTIEASLDRQSNFLASNASGGLTFKGRSRLVVLEEEWPELVQGSNFTVVGRLTDELNQSLGGRSVRLLNDEVVADNTTTDGQGRFTLFSQLDSRATGLRTLWVKFDGDALHTAAPSASNEQQIRLPTQLVLEGLPYEALANTSVEVTIRLTQGVVPEPFAGPTQVTVKIIQSPAPGSQLTTLEENRTVFVNGSGLGLLNLELKSDYSKVTLQAYYPGGDGHLDSSALRTIQVVVPPPPKENVLNKWLPLIIGLPLAIIATLYYLWWAQRHKYEVLELLRQMRSQMNETDDYRRIIIQAYYQFCNIMTRYNFIREPAHTAREFKRLVLRALPLEPENVEALTEIFEIARYSQAQDSMVDEMGMKWADGSYQLWCQDSLDKLKAIEADLGEKLKRTLWGKIITRQGKERVSG